MKKAGIISLYGNYNFGNRLQNYAVQEALKNIGIESKAIRYFSSEESDRIRSF